MPPSADVARRMLALLQRRADGLQRRLPQLRAELTRLDVLQDAAARDLDVLHADLRRVAAAGVYRCDALLRLRGRQAVTLAQIAGRRAEVADLTALRQDLAAALEHVCAALSVLQRRQDRHRRRLRALHVEQRRRRDARADAERLEGALYDDYRRR